MSNSTLEGDYIALKPNRDLLNTQFEKYMLSNDTCPISKLKLEKNVRHLLPTEKQWAFQYVKMYSQFDKFVVDRHYSTTDHVRFYLVLENGFILTTSFNCQARKWDNQRIVHKVLIPNDKFGIDGTNKYDRLPESIIFPDENYAFVGNGCGAVTLFRTYNRDKETKWTPLLTYVMNEFEDNDEVFGPEKYNDSEEFYRTPCIIADARRTNFNQFDVLLQSIFERDESEVKADKEKSKFATRLVWLTISIDNHRNFKVNHVRTFNCDGRLDFATLDKDSKSIITVGGRKPKLMKDTAMEPSIQKESVSSGIGTPPVQPAESMEQDTDITNSTYAYVWTQTSEDVSAVFKVGEEITKKDIEFELKPSKISIKIRGVTLLNGTLFSNIDVDSSTWTFGNHILELTLFKTSTISWTDLVVGDKRGIYQSDPKTVADAMEQLEKFTSDKEVAGFDGSGPGFNKEELEECDQSEYEITYVSWLDDKTHKVVRYSDISSHQILFTLRLSPGGPVSFCLRHDVDAIFWSLEEDNPIEHKFTLNAFGYVQAGKQSRRFTTCSVSGEYAVITDRRNHAYIYWQNVPLDPECSIMNRKTGKTANSVAKQLVLSMARLDEDYTEDDPLQEFIGVYAHENVFFLLTHNTIYANVIKQIAPISMEETNAS